MKDGKLFTSVAEKSNMDLTGLLAGGSDALAAAYRELLAGEEVDTAGIEYLPPFALSVSV